MGKSDKQPRRHHYVPQFLLRNFVDAQGKVNIYDKLKGQARKQVPKEIAFEKDMYVAKVGEKAENFEHLATLFDEFGSTPIRKIIQFEAIKVLTPEERYKLSCFVASLIIRVPHTRISSLAFNAHAISQWGPDICGEGTNVPLSAFDEQAAKNMTIGMLANDSTEFASIINKKVWFLKKAPPANKLYISDNPIARHNMFSRPFRGNLGLSNDGIEIYLPLTPNLVLAMICKELAELASHVPETGIHKAFYTDTPIDLKPENVEHLNSLQIGNAERFIFSGSDDFWLVADMIREFPDLAKGSNVVQIN